MDIKENIYGHKKKLEFILGAIKDYSRSNSMPLSELKVLDFGCGNGTAVSYHIAALGVQLTGVDVHFESIKFANTNNRFPNAKFIEGNEDTVLELKGYFDIIIYSDIIEHLLEPELVIKKLRSVHKDSGILISAIPNGYGPFELEKRIYTLPIVGYLWRKFFEMAYKIRVKVIRESWEPFPDSLPCNVDCGHVQFFTLRSFNRLMKNSDYKVLKIRNGSFLGTPVSEPFLGFQKFILWNVRIADKLPPYLVSTWYFICEKEE